MIPTPTHPDLVEQLSTDMQTRGVGDARVRGSILWVLVHVLVVALRAIYQWLTYASRQVLPDSADTEHLRRHAAIWQITPRPAVAAQGDVTFSGTPAAEIAAGSRWQRSDGVVYTVDALVTIGGGGTATGAVTAEEAGAAGNAVLGVVLTVVSPISGVDSEASVASGGLTGGVDDESDEELRERILERIGTPPQGGAIADYVAWAKTVPGVDEVWVAPEELGRGTVVVRFVVEGSGAAIIPDAGEIALVQAAIDARRPVTADVTVEAPDDLPIDMDITLTPDTAPARTAVEASLESLFARERGPGLTIANSHLRDAISAGQRSVHPSGSYTLDDVDSDGTGLSDVVQGATEVARPGAITWG